MGDTSLICNSKIGPCYPMNETEAYVCSIFSELNFKTGRETGYKIRLL